MRRWLPVALLLLASARGGVAAEHGVIAELPFLDEVPLAGVLGDNYIGVDLGSLAPLPMVLDTGAQASMMTPLYARALGVPVNKINEGEYQRRATSLGRDLQFQVDTSSSDTGSRTGFEVGLLGANFLREYVVEVDYSARRVRLLDPGVHGLDRESPEPGEVVLPFRYTNMRPEVEVRLGNGSAWFVIDTGSPGGLEVSFETATRLGIEVPPTAQRILAASLLGTYTARVVPIHDVRIGDERIVQTHLEVAISEGSVYRVTNLAGVDGALFGNAILRRFRVRFDYPNQLVGLKRIGPDPSIQEELAPFVISELPAPRPPTITPSETTSAAAQPPPEGFETGLDPERDVLPVLRVKEDIWLDVQAPERDVTLRGEPAWVEVEGWAGVGEEARHQVAVVVDLSGSTAVASGADVDGDGTVGRVSRVRDSWRSFNPSRLSSDSGDTVLAAELVAIRRLIELLDPARSRIGIVSFWGRARLDAAVGSSREAVAETLHVLDGAFAGGGTNLEDAIDVAANALLADEVGPGWRRSILLLSDGYPNDPAAALRAARRAAAEGIRIFSFLLGVSSVEDDDVYATVASLSGGRLVRVPQPGNIVHELPRLNLADVARLQISNLTTAQDGRALHVFPDGSFSGLAPLVRGRNVVRVVAVGDGGGHRVEDRVVHFEDGPVREEALQRMRDRSIEIELATRPKRGPTREKAVEIEVDREPAETE